MSQLFPPVLDPRTLQRQVWNTDTARRIPGVGRALAVTAGLASVMSLDAFRGIDPLPRPRILEQPDLQLARSTFVRMSLEDYLLEGNAASYVTARFENGWPAAVSWYPAHEWHAMIDPRTGRRRYWLRGREVNPDDVVHVQNGADPLNPARGVGVVEQYVRSLDRVALQEERERTDISEGQVPSIAVVAPASSDASEEDLDEAAVKWEEKFQAPGRKPVFLPDGTKVLPLSWSPSDAESQAARKASLQDVANMFNVDGYYLGAPASSHTYRTPGLMFTVHVRLTLNPLLAPFEDVWSMSWLPRGQRVTFAREEVQEDDLGTLVGTLTKASGGPVMLLNEARSRLKLAPVPGGDEMRSAAAPEEPAPESDDQDDPADDPANPEQDPENPEDES